MKGAQPGPLPTTVLTTGQGHVFAISPSPVALSPGRIGRAGFMVQSSDVPSNGQQTCPVVSTMNVRLPGISSVFDVKENFTACGGPTISVSAIVGASALPSS